MIDDTIYNTVAKKGDLLKAFNDFEKFKFKMLEEKLKPSNMVDRKAYTIPNFIVRDLEVQRLKNNKSKRSEKNNDLVS